MNKKLFLLPVVGYLAYRLQAETKTTPIEGDNAIAELRMVEVNGTKLATLIRGQNRNNPILLCVAGGPFGTDIPFIKKYETELEKYFTIVHYDQRGAGKSHELGTDYSTLTADQHVDDLITLTKILKEALQQDTVYLLGHSYGTYLGSLAVQKEPDLYKAYIGIGQMSDTVKAETYAMENCIEAAKEAGNTQDVEFLESKLQDVKDGKMFAPRKYLRKYKFASRENHHEMADFVKMVLFGDEYNLGDGIKFFYGASRYGEPLAMQTVEKPLSDLVKSYPIPAYFILGQYDGQTNTKAAREYFDSLEGTQPKEFIVFENSAHSPHIEENERFVDWMINDFLPKNKA